MAGHLIAISVGPVQEFIAAARRTRDLWFGSEVLSRVSRAAAAAVRDAGGKLIFPYALEADNVANVILAELPEAEPSTVAGAARQGARTRWRELAQEVASDAQMQPCVDKARWEQQVDDVIEVYSAWVPYVDESTYARQRARVMRLLAGRKACRDFRSSGERQMRIRKSSLDGARETVLLASAKRPKKLRLNPGEQLDVVGLTKRHGIGHRHYPSVARIAADPWLYGMQGNDAEVLSQLLQAGKQLQLADSGTKVGEPQYRHFPFDGAALYIERHNEIREEAENSELASAALASFHLRSAYAKAGQPSPYLAILSADGDGMGDLIAGIQTADRHRDLCKALARFASEAKGEVARHFGALIYAGGDDVLALVPLDMALACAKALHDLFGEALQGFGKTVTLSVGIGVGHFMEPLEDLLGYAREAEKSAKAKGLPEAKNGLAIHLHTRSGAPSKVRGRWNSGFPKRMATLIELYADEKLADKAGYDLEEAARKYDKVTAPWLAEALPGEAAYVLSRKQGSANAPELRELLGTATDADKLRGIARELMIARRLARSYREGGRRSPLSPGTLRKEAA